MEFNSSVKVEGVNEGNPDFFADDEVSFFHAKPVFMDQLPKQRKHLNTSDQPSVTN